MAHEIAAGAGHAVRALLKERVGAVPVCEIEVLPRFAGSGSTSLDSVAIDQDLDGADIAREIAGIVIGLRQRGRRDLRVVLC